MSTIMEDSGTQDQVMSSLVSKVYFVKEKQCVIV